MRLCFVICDFSILSRDRVLGGWRTELKVASSMNRPHFPYGQHGIFMSMSDLEGVIILDEQNWC